MAKANSSREARQSDEVPKWRNEHARIRKAFGCDDRFQQEAFDAAAISLSGAAAGIRWSHGYCNRESELIKFLCMWLGTPAIVGLAKRYNCVDFFVNISEPSSHGRAIFPGFLPTLLTTHYMAWIKVSLETAKATFQRHLLGLEHLFALVFPSTIKCHGISDSGLRHLAGNSMSVHFLTALYILFFTVDFEMEPGNAPPAVREEGSAVFKMVPHAATPFEATSKRYLPGDVR